jgi:arylformamidase
VQREVLHDVTLPLAPGTAVYRGDPPVTVRLYADLPGQGFRASAMGLSLHAGTHVDGPCHLACGAAGVDAWPLRAFLGPAQVVDCQPPQGVSAEFLSAHLDSWVERVLLMTGGGPALRAGQAGGGYLTECGARFLIERGVILVGIDSLSIDAPHATALPAHRALLRQGVVVVEGLDLDEVTAGTWDLLCLPLRVVDGDGAPARVLLRRPGSG